MNMDDNQKKDEIKDEILRRISSVEVSTAKSSEDELKSNYIKVPLSDLSLAGANLIPFSNLIIEALKNKQLNNGDFFKLSIKPDSIGTLKLKDGKTIGNMIGADGHTISGRAEFVKANITKSGAETVACAEMAAISVMLVAIIVSLNDIKDSQEDMNLFIHAEKKAELDGNISYLTELMNDLKYNLDNKTFISNMHLKTQDIKQSAKQTVYLYRDTAKATLSKRKMLITNQDGYKVVDSLKSSLIEYRKAIYVYAYSSYLEILSLGNFNSDYLEKEIKQIKEYESEYRDFFTQCSIIVEELNSSTIISGATKVASTMTSKLGKIINKTPIGDKTSIDEKLIKEGGKIKSNEVNRVNKSVKEFGELRTADVASFVKNIQLIENVYNQEIEMITDGDYLYLPKADLEKRELKTLTKAVA